MAATRPDTSRTYLDLDQPDHQVFCTYVFVDGTLENVRCKVRVLSYEPKSPEECPEITICRIGSEQSANVDVDSEVILAPVALFKDPFLRGRNKLVLCEVVTTNRQPEQTNTRSPCKKTMEKAADQEPWFGIEQEYVLLERNGVPLGWPTHGHCIKPNKVYFHAVGAENTAGRQVVLAHLKACAFSGIKLYGSDSEAVIAQWEYQVGPLPGVEAGDHLWMSRYILQRVAEDFDVVVSFKPRPFLATNVPGNSGHINFSTKASRQEGGINWIKNALPRLAATHEMHLRAYDPSEDRSNDMRLNCALRGTPRRDFAAAFCSRRAACVRVPQSTVSDGRGYLEDRRPGANVEPYRAMQALVQTLCLDD
ncbi:glutamine synthetase, mitochondrial-like [Haemaphysalis longicornis]